MKEKINLRKLVLCNGIDYPTNEELVMLILGSGTKQNPIEKLSGEILQVLSASNRDNLVSNLLKIDGVGRNKALSIAASLELGTRLNRRPQAYLNKPADVVPYVQSYAIASTEHFLCITVTGCREILSINVVSVGAGNMALVHPREIFSVPIKEQASGVIFCHNHPSGNPNPSQSDIDTTHNLIKGAEILGISVLDHIIISRQGYYSFLENEMLK